MRRSEEEFKKYIKEYGHIFKEFNIPIEKNMEIKDYKVYRDSIVIRLRRKRSRENLLTEYIED